ncbi:hybrid sensor histidine kinase/response regulator transcription factor [Croceiramulus getboli]|nr:tetratricopeptide repeat protein [Flavobacteriaceae bacterium YJPT1-3]
MRRYVRVAFLMFSLSLWGQDNPKKIQSNQLRIDSLIQRLDYDQALQLAYDNLKIARLAESKLLLAKTQTEIADLFFRKDNFDSTQIYAERAIDLAKEHSWPEVITQAYLALGNVHYARFEDNKAIAIYQQIDSIAESTGIQQPHVVNAFYNLGKVLLRSYSVQDTTYIGKAEDYFKKGIDMALAIPDTDEEHYGYIMLGNIYGQRGEFRKALPYFEKSLTYFESQDEVKNTALIYWSLGIIQTDLKNYDQAEAYYRKRLDLLTKTGRPLEIAEANRVYAGFLVRIGKHQEAIPYLQKAYDYFQRSDAGYSGVLQGIVNALAASYRETGDYRKATDFYQRALVIKDSLEARKQKDLALELEAKYQNQKKEQQIALLNIQSELLELRQKRQRSVLLIGIIITSVAGVVLFILYRNRQGTNRRLKELDAAKSNFFTNISHELRTPLTLIHGPVEEELENPELSKRSKSNLEIAKRNTERLATLVNQMLDLSQLEAGFYKLQVTPGPLSSFLKLQLESFAYSAAKKSQRLNMETDLSEKQYWYDPDVLQKILVNLLGNAIKYSPEQADIYFNARVEADTLLFTVRNTGVALNKMQLGAIFDRFHRSHEQETGSGIGLALTKELVSLHKGEIVASSRKNSVSFQVRMPVNRLNYTAAEQGTTTKRAEPSTHPQDPEIDHKEWIEIEEVHHSEGINTQFEEQEIILVVDDSEDVRTFLSGILESEYRVITAPNGKIGFQKAIQEVPDLIITDLMMPEDDGLQLTENCKKDDATSHIPVIMLTAKAGDENRLEGLETGADIYITKPFSSKILKQTIENLLTTRKKLQNRFRQEVILTPKEISISSYDERFLESLQQVLDEHLVASDFNAEAFAEALHMSRMQLHRKLKALTGQTTSEFIRNQRLKLAVSLLENSDLNISEIGYQVGFNDHSYFTKCFRESYGSSPSEFCQRKSS